jgi:hypothetical protein
MLYDTIINRHQSVSLSHQGCTRLNRLERSLYRVSDLPSKMPLTLKAYGQALVAEITAQLTRLKRYQRRSLINYLTREQYS